MNMVPSNVVSVKPKQNRLVQRALSQVFLFTVG
jgi:hypothetical protein